MGDQPELQYGSDDQQWVSYLQELLNWQLPARGSGTTVTTSGIFDEATMYAVRELQDLAGLTPDAVVGDKTWEILIAEPPPMEGGGSGAIDFADQELTININEMDPTTITMDGTNVGSGNIPAGAVVMADINGANFELRASRDFGAGEQATFISDDNPEGWQQDVGYTVTASAELGGATKSGTVVTHDNSGY